MHAIKHRRHYTTFNSETHVPDLTERPFKVDPSRAFNHMQNAETDSKTPRTCVPTKAANNMQNAESTPWEVKVPGWSSRINSGNIKDILAQQPSPCGTPSRPRRLIKGVEQKDPSISARPVRSVAGGTTTLQADLK